LADLAVGAVWLRAATVSGVKCHRQGRRKLRPTIYGKHHEDWLPEPGKAGLSDQAVELKSGRILVGIIRSEIADELTLIDAAGAKQVIKVGDVESRKKIGKSLMPDGLQGGLTPADLADLIDYLQTLRDKSPELPKKTTSELPSVN
jgi:hypothetical protein